MKLQWFHILLALSNESLHGYAIQRSVLDRTAGKLRLWPATLYRLLAALEDEGYIEGTDGPDDMLAAWARAATGDQRARRGGVK
jgi:DNA-binding PadR family transcriptional regulator